MASNSVGAVSVNCFFQSLIWLGRVAGAMQFIPLADSGQRVLFFEDFKHDFELEVSGKLALGLAFHTSLNLTRYLT